MGFNEFFHASTDKPNDLQERETDRMKFIHKLINLDFAREKCEKISKIRDKIQNLNR